MALLKALSAVCLAALTGGCSSVPDLSEATGAKDSKDNSVFLGDVVNRVKCELAYAFGPKLDDPRYAWLKDWSIKADLTLQANDQGGGGGDFS